MEETIIYSKKNKNLINGRLERRRALPNRSQVKISLLAIEIGQQSSFLKYDRPFYRGQQHSQPQLTHFSGEKVKDELAPEAVTQSFAFISQSGAVRARCLRTGQEEI